MEEVTTWVTEVVEKLGYMGVALLVALENVFPPIPSEAVLPWPNSWPGAAMPTSAG